MTNNNIAIRVRNLGKKYTVGGPQEKYLTLRDAMVSSIKAPFKRFQWESLSGLKILFRINHSRHQPILFNHKSALITIIAVIKNAHSFRSPV